MPTVRRVPTYTPPYVRDYSLEHLQQEFGQAVSSPHSFNSLTRVFFHAVSSIKANYVEYVSPDVLTDSIGNPLIKTNILIIPEPDPTYNKFPKALACKFVSDIYNDVTKKDVKVIVWQEYPACQPLNGDYREGYRFVASYGTRSLTAP